MIATLWILAVLGFIVVGGLVFSRLHPNFQDGRESLPNQPK